MLDRFLGIVGNAKRGVSLGVSSQTIRGAIIPFVRTPIELGQCGSDRCRDSHLAKRRACYQDRDSGEES